MKELFGRKNELGLLEKRYESPHFEFGYVYGQRRIGKTALMQMFSKGKKSLLFYATESSDSINLSSFASTLSSVSGRHYGQFENWYSFFQAIDAYFGDEKGVMVIDEYTNIVAPGDARKSKGDFQSSLQKAIDLLFVKRRFVLILTGSNVSFMEREIGNGEAPLYKRNTFSLRVGKFDFDESLLAFGKTESDWEKARLLCLTSTFPYYLSLIDDSQSLEANLDLLFYNQDAVFVDSPSKIITSAKARGWWYSSILDAIANGYGTLNGICAFLKADSSEIYNYIKELIADGVLTKRELFMSKRSVHYEFLDPVLAFYYRFIRKRAEEIKNGFGAIIKKEQQAAIGEFIERSFEKVCISYLECLSKKGRLNGAYTSFQNYQVDNSKLGRSIELDIVSKSGDSLLVGEAKLSKRKRPAKDYFDMKEDTSVAPFSVFKTIDYYLFGASGFTDDLLSQSDAHLHLVDLKAMFGI